jgi:hypothetical protein
MIVMGVSYPHEKGYMSEKKRTGLLFDKDVRERERNSRVPKSLKVRLFPCVSIRYKAQFSRKRQSRNLLATVS